MEKTFSIKTMFFIIIGIVALFVAGSLDLGWWSYLVGPLMAMASLEMMYEGTETEGESVIASIIGIFFAPICEFFSLYLFYYTSLFFKFVCRIIELLGLQGLVGIIIIVPVIFILIILGVIS